MAQIGNLQKKQIDLIRESICVYDKCVQCRDLYKDGKLCFDTIEDFVDDRGRSCLFRLKEMCHDLFRSSSDAGYKEKLYDMTVGYIFHEAMKLREDLYQLEYYAPKSDIELTNQEKKIVREIEILVVKARKRMGEGFKEIRVLLRELVGQMKDLIRLYKDNYLLPRFIYENERALVRIYGRRGLEGLLNEMYSDGKALLTFKAAESYLTSEYYDVARSLFHRVRLLDKRNEAAIFLYLYASAFHFYYRNMFTKALGCAREAASMESAKGIGPVYKTSLARLISDLSREVKA